MSTNNNSHNNDAKKSDKPAPNRVTVEEKKAIGHANAAAAQRAVEKYRKQHPANH